MKNASATKVERKEFLLKNVRLSYPNLFTPRAMKDDKGEEKKPQFSASFILDKTEHAAIIKAVDAEAKKIATDKWGKVPVKFRGPLRDGSTFVDAETDEIKDGHSEETVGISASSKSKQHSVNRDLTPAEEDTLYGGCYVNAVISLFPWKHPTGGSGVSANLGCVQFFRNGERFGGKVSKPEDHFEDLGQEDEGDDDAPTPPVKTGKKKKAAPVAQADDDEDEDDMLG